MEKAHQHLKGRKQSQTKQNCDEYPATNILTGRRRVFPRNMCDMVEETPEYVPLHCHRTSEKSPGWLRTPKALYSVRPVEYKRVYGQPLTVVIAEKRPYCLVSIEVTQP